MISKQQIRTSRLICLASFSGLLISFIAEQLAAIEFNWGVLLFLALPLLICLPGMIKGNTRSYVWLGCLLLFYSAKFFSDLVVSDGAWISVIQTLLSLTVFCSAMLYTRWRGLQRKNHPSTTR